MSDEFRTPKQEQQMLPIYGAETKTAVWQAPVRKRGGASTGAERIEQRPVVQVKRTDTISGGAIQQSIEERTAPRVVKKVEPVQEPEQDMRLRKDEQSAIRSEISLEDAASPRRRRRASAAAELPEEAAPQSVPSPGMYMRDVAYDRERRAPEKKNDYVMPVRSAPQPRQVYDDERYRSQTQSSGNARQYRPPVVPSQRAAAPQMPERDYMDSGLPEEEEEPPRRHGALTAVIVVVAIIALFFGVVFLTPASDSGILGAITNLRAGIAGAAENITGSLLGKKKDYSVSEFSATVSRVAVGNEICLTATTGKDVENVRLINDLDEVLTANVSPTRNNSNTIWGITLEQSDAYEGDVRLSILAGGEWVLTDSSIYIEVYRPTSTPPVESTVTPPPSDGAEPVYTPEAGVIVLTSPETTSPASFETPEPAVEATEEPTQEPTEAPTPEPTAEPAPTAEPTRAPTPMPYFPAMPSDEALPSALGLNGNIISDGKTLVSFSRETEVQMSAPDDYAQWKAGILCFRGGPFRQNAAFGTADISEESMSILWENPVGGKDTYYGVYWTGQPAIVKWPQDVRNMMNIIDEKKSVTALKEVIYATQDGKIYFYDLNDGEKTREAIELGYPMRASVSLDPRGIPLLAVGQGISKLNGKTGDIGYYLYSLLDQKRLAFINGRDKNAPGTNGAFDSSALFDRNSDTMIVAGENGLLYTVKLNQVFDVENVTLDIKPETVAYSAVAKKQADTKTGIEGSVAMYGSYAYYADAYGILRCVDVNTMSTVWAIDTGDNTDATIALEMEGLAVSLYTANTELSRSTSKKTCTVRKLNALTGAEIWSADFPASYIKNTETGAMASPIVGENELSDVVIFTIMNSKNKSTVVALYKESGETKWSHELEASTWSSPVAVYTDSGKAYILQGDNDGILTMLSSSGKELETLDLGGAIIGSPAVYQNKLVVGTSAKKDSKIVCVELK
ncbi:MAG: PQQ-binding-like beta-propeller repeat protein [Eubacteriales bacterium]|nr:PQQ-binding-like beta-propeller repeat protein [Eubacteriales bacterium]MDD3881295.1 PQQ-binding-like beta-propeller repeat protein [Eubacteriales bacterium]MDD4512213.1 PQQ-binding-like beta-propeller repeat protein [Eubacteriales bacterium]